MDWIKKVLAPKPSAAETARVLGRNDLCWCGSGKKYKRCHLAEDTSKRIEAGHAARFAARRGGGIVPQSTAKKGKAGRNLPPEASAPPQG